MTSRLKILGDHAMAVHDRFTEQRSAKSTVVRIPLKPKIKIGLAGSKFRNAATLGLAFAYEGVIVPWDAEAFAPLDAPVLCPAIENESDAEAICGVKQNVFEVAYLLQRVIDRGSRRAVFVFTEFTLFLRCLGQRQSCGTFSTEERLAEYRATRP